MDRETISYIINYFSPLLTAEERAAIRHTMSNYKLEGENEKSPYRERIYREKGWITSDESVLDLLKDGYETFELNAATRILNQNPEKVFLNTCKECGKLARTPYAKQCRFCGCSWHESVVAHYQFERAFQLTDRPFFIIGKLLKGKAKPGNFVDLLLLGLNKRVKIDAIEYMRKQQEGKVVELEALMLSELTEEDKKILRTKTTRYNPLDILSSR